LGEGTFDRLRGLSYVIDDLAPPPTTLEALEPFEELFRRHFSGLVRFAALLGTDDPDPPGLTLGRVRGDQERRHHG